jgi:hypothetical protein
MDKRIKGGTNVNKTNINDIIENAVTFKVYTKFGDKFPDLNQDKFEFITDKLIKISIGYKKYAYIDIGAINRIDITEV